MPEKSHFQIDIPGTDILSYLFPPGSTPSDTPIWVDAQEPEKYSLSPRQLLAWVQRLCLGLQELGLQQNDVVMIHSTNHIFVPVIYLGVTGSGYIFSGCNPAYGVAEVKFQVENTEAKLLLVEPGLLDIALKAADLARRTRLEKLYWLLTKVRAMVTEAYGLPRVTNKDSSTQLLIRVFTTGLPKGVMISHRNVIAQVEQSIFMRHLEQPYTPSTRPQERWLGFLPLYHAYGQLWSIAAACRTLSPCYLMNAFNYVDFLSNIQNHKITHIQTAPPIIVMLGKRPETKNYDLSSLQNILCGAAPLSKELQNEVSDRLKVKIVQTWGMTEVTCSSLHVPGSMDDRSGCAGLIDPNAEIKLVSDEGEEIGPGKRGEIHIRGPNVCLGYWKNEAATKAAFDNEGFLKTGDIAIKNKEGWYWIVDRKKELIKVRGFQVAPAELEAVLLTHNDVADAAVVALQADHDELPLAFVVLSPSSRARVSELDIQMWMAKEVARHKHLTGGVRFVDEIPKTASGKIIRKVVKEWAKKERKAKL